MTDGRLTEFWSNQLQVVLHWLTDSLEKGWHRKLEAITVWISEKFLITRVRNTHSLDSFLLHVSMNESSREFSHLHWTTKAVESRSIYKFSKYKVCRFATWNFYKIPRNNSLRPLCCTVNFFTIHFCSLITKFNRNIVSFDKSWTPRAMIQITSFHIYVLSYSAGIISTVLRGSAVSPLTIHTLPSFPSYLPLCCKIFRTHGCHFSWLSNSVCWTCRYFRRTIYATIRLSLSRITLFRAKTAPSILYRN